MFGFLHFSIIDLLDILMVAILIFVVLRFIKGSTAVNIFIAVILVLLVQIISSAIGLKMISSVLGTIIDVGAIALIIIFQPELRRFLNNLGRSAGQTLEKRPFLQKLFPSKMLNVDTKAMVEISDACRLMSEQKVGALIVISRGAALNEIVATGDLVDAQISSRLIRNIFFKNSPLHDGAMIIGDNRIVAARCTLPISERADLPAQFGMRHKAAIGISEQSDAAVVVVSEETGEISYVRRGQVSHIQSINDLKLLLDSKNNE